MAEQAPEIKVKLTAEDTGVAAAIRQLGQELKNLKNNEQQAAEGALNLRKAFESLAAIAAVLKLAEVGRDAFDSAVNIGKMADKTGLSTETLSVFHKVAGDVAVSTEAVDKGLIKATKTITEFEQGNQKAAKGFALLGISAKDFAGLKPDEKIRLVTERLGAMQAGFQKATAAQLIFSKGGSEMIPVLNSLAGQGFDAATAATSKLGLLLDRQTTDTFRAAKASLQELTDVGKGLTTQFEAGLLPAVSDVAESLLDALGDDGAGKSFRDLGKTVGDVIRGIVFAIESVGIAVGHTAAEVEEIFDFAFNHTKQFAQSTFAAIGGYIRGGIGGASVAAAQQLTSSADNATKDFAARILAIGKDADAQQQKIYDSLFPSDEEEARRQAERVKRLRPDKETPEQPLVNEAGIGAELKRQTELDAIAKAQAAALVRQLQDELEIWRAYEKQREEVEKNSYEQGNLSTEQYYAKRQADLKTETEKELELLKAELKAAQDEVARTAGERDKFAGKAKTAGPDTKIGQAYDAAATRANQENIAALTRVDELQTKIATTTINGQTKSLALDKERIKATETDEEKVARFEAEIAQLQGKRVEQTKAQIEAEAEVRRGELERKGGLSTAEIDAEIEKWKQLKLALGEFESAEDALHQKEKAFEVDRNAFDLQRSAIEAQQRAGLITKRQAEKEINDLIAQRLPLLRQEAAAELAAAQEALKRAQATGNQDEIAKAQQQVLAARNLGIELDKLGTKTKQLQTQIVGAFQSSFQNFFNSLITGTKSVGQAFAQLGISIVQDLERIAAQMLIDIAIEKVLSALGFGGQNKKSTADQEAQVQANTGEAASTVFKEAIEAVPFPYNLAAAPAAAAAVEAEMAPFAAQASGGGGLGTAAKGALLDKDMLVQAHAEEMILPRHLSSGLQQAIRSDHFSVPQLAATQGPIGRAGGDKYFAGDTYNLHHTGPDARQVLERELVPMIQSARRKGKL